jgi:hypothetical protein
MGVGASVNQDGFARAEVGFSRFRAALTIWLTACHAGIAALLMIGLALPTSLSARSETIAKPRIAFAGDSISDNYWSGITRFVEANSCLKGSAQFGRFAHVSTGLTRGDRLYWPREIRRIVDSFVPTLLVLTIGLNDRQFIVDGTGSRTAWGAPNWSDKYRQEIVEFLKGAVAKNTIVLLIGLPVMRAEVDNSDVAEKNDMFMEAVNKFDSPRLHYVEPWRLKPSGPDVFASYGPDKNGKLVQIRTPDGQHFTAAGEDLVAAYLFPKIVAALEEAGTVPEQCIKQTSSEH